MGHHWTDHYSKAELDEKDERDVQVRIILKLGFECVDFVEKYWECPECFCLVKGYQSAKKHYDKIHVSS